MDGFGLGQFYKCDVGNFINVMLVILQLVYFCFYKVM